MIQLTCTPEQEDAINATLPTHIRVKAIGGKLGGDLLDECGSGGLYENAASIIEQLPRTTLE